MREIPLTNSSKMAIVDDEDFERVAQYSWYEDVGACTSYVASRDVIKGQQVRLHRFVLGLDVDDSLEVDHRNNNGLINNKDNLRVCSHAQNCANSNHGVGESGYRGVHLNSRGKYVAKITVNFKQMYLGSFNDVVSAAKAYDEAAIKHFGEFARPNFVVDAAGA